MFIALWIARKWIVCGDRNIAAIVVRAFEMPQLRAKSVIDVCSSQLVIEAHSKNVEATIVFDLRVTKVISYRAMPSVVDVGVRNDRLARKNVGPIVFQRVP